ncbi:Magnesium transporter MgtE [Aquisphaera giovannonii]|uniref:Magnesium transporter MgtE n=1 Tax=Aquisphaera giovannonii TaxID=406548 RepID=A0A5B9W411_9BACT|nr:magnesium transporter [Aquisphaera giovannonii]QEH35318.1 Magnesium transporter MgtE [Aquisphaera giovannonii]
MRNALLIPDLRELIRGGEAAALREFIEDQHPGRTAELIEDLEAEDGDALFRVLPPRDRAEVLSYLDTDSQNRIVESMPLREAAELLHLMSHDERADLVKRLDEDFVDGVLPHLAQAERDDIRRLTSYEPGTAGAVMTTDYVVLPAHIPVREALERLRHEAPDKETIYYCYIVDHNRRLIGFVSLRTLILSRRSAMIEDIMQRDVIFGRVDEDQESAARQIDKYDLIALPVVDTSNRLVGIITHDDAMDILRQEQTEDILKFGGVSPDPEADTAPYWSSTVPDVVRRRIKWLLMLFLAGELTIPVMEHFEWIKARFPVLDDFLPLLLGTGGNAGSQTVGTVIRGMSLGEIKAREAWRVVLREWLTGLCLGLMLGLVGVLYVRFRKGRPWGIALVVGLTLLGICTWSNTIGALVPLLARRMGIDPAVISAPFISTLVDATGLVIYFTTAITLLIKWGS